MNKKIGFAASTALLSVFLASAQAADFSYNYLQLDYQDRDLNGLNSEDFQLSGSIDLGNHLNVIGGYTSGDVTVGLQDLNFDEMSIGIGFHAPVADSVDVTATLEAVNHDQDLIGDDTGYRLGVGLRSWITDGFELNASVGYLDIYDQTDTSYTLGSRFHVNDAVSLGVSYSNSSEDVEVISGGLRIDF